MNDNENKMPSVTRGIVTGVASALCILTPVYAAAQSALLEEIVVTAQKREQSLQDVGVSVTAFSGDQLSELGFTKAIDVVSQTPGLEVSGAGGGTINTYSIRGVTQNDFAASQEGPVALYVDDAYISLNTISNFSLLDVDRVEVLRGPQGTLFGRNATGGLLHFISRRPTQETEGFIDLQLGQDGRQRVEGALSGGLSESTSGRISFLHNSNDGLMSNDIGTDLMLQDEWAARAQLQFDVSDDLSVLLVALYGEQDDAAGGYGHTVAFDGAFSTDPTATDFFGYRDADGDPYTVSQDFDGYKEAEASNLSMHVNWAVGGGELVSITNFQGIENAYGEDADATPYDIYNFEALEDVDQFSQEFRYNFSGDKHNSVIGLYYLNIDGRYSTVQSGDAYFGTGVGYPAGTTEDVVVDQDTETVALFGQTELTLNDVLSLTLGLRYNRDEKDYDFRSTDIYFLQGGNFRYTDSFSDSDWAAKAQLNYSPSDEVLLYAGVSRGIKSGGFNMPLYPLAEQDFEFGGEVLVAYELGWKASLGDRTRLNGSVYYYDYQDYQAYSFDGFATFLFNANADTFGGELELTTSPIDGLDILFGVSYLDTEVTDVPLNISPTGTEDGVLSPKLSFNGLIRYSFPLGAGAMTAQLDGSWKDDHNFNLSFTPVIQQSAFGLANARLIYETDDGHWWGSVFVRNITDKDYRSYGFDTTGYFGATEDVLGIPRWAGVSLRYSW